MGDSGFMCRADVPTKNGNLLIVHYNVDKVKSVSIQGYLLI